MSKHGKPREQVFVIMRADLFHGVGAGLEITVIPKAVYRNETKAAREVERLNKLNPDGQVRYWLVSSRMFLDE